MKCWTGEKIKMYCPKCSMLLTKENNHYICTSGFLEYSTYLTQKMDTLYKSLSSDINKGDFTGNIYCPQCGKMLNNGKRNDCKITIKAIQFQLIELHPHNTPNGICI
ncbi:MAG: hypothetical protein JXB49_06325 [Bacteroidales bacterium]|nr:hypothetical protein [Bacteroidales bacterium]